MLQASNSTERCPISPTRDLPNPNLYVKLLMGEFSHVAFDEIQAPPLKGQWRKKAFGIEAAEGSGFEIPMDFEIGTGNGTHFANFAVNHPDRLLVGTELKFKPLIQSIRRAMNKGAKNARIFRYDAFYVDQVFAEGELDNVFIHFPDPWPKKRQWKHRLVEESFLRKLHRLQKPGSYVDFKTDSSCYFEWSLERIPTDIFEVTDLTRDLHTSPVADRNFVTHFESLFLKQGLKINYVRLMRKG